MTQVIHFEGWIGVSQIQEGGDSGEVKILGRESSISKVTGFGHLLISLLLLLQCTYTSSNIMLVTVLVILFSKKYMRKRVF